jgi:hypothetical protein
MEDGETRGYQIDGWGDNKTLDIAYVLMYVRN